MTNVTVHGQDTTAKLLERYETDVTRLEKENDTLKGEIAKLMEEIGELRRIAPEGEAKGEDKKEEKDMAPVDSLWAGKFGSTQNGREAQVQNDAARVIQRDSDAVTISIKNENGRNWEYDFKFTVLTKFQLVGGCRIATASGVNLATAVPVGVVT